MGQDCGIDNLDAVTKSDHLCNELGLDSISVGATVACAMDLFEAGCLIREDTGGLDVSFRAQDLQPGRVHLAHRAPAQLQRFATLPL